MSENDSKNLGGRPRIIESPEEFDRLVEAYVAECRENAAPVLLTGVILALGLNSKNAFYEYGQREGFQDSVKRARLLVENEYEKALHGKNPTGPIFALKNFDWKDKSEVDNNHGGEVVIKWEG